MKFTKKWSGGWFIAILLAAMIALGGCSAGPGNIKVDVSTPDKVNALDCKAILAAKPKFDSATGPNAAAGERRSKLRDLGFTKPDDTEAVATAKKAFDAKAADCLKQAISATPTPAATSTTASPSASASAAPSPTITVATNSADFVGWDQVTLNPPRGLKDEVDAHTGDVGFTWADIQKWGDVRVDGKAPRVRVVLVDGNFVTDADARKKAHAGKDTPIGSDTPVVHVKTCSTVSGAGGCPSRQSVRVILAPIVADKNGAYALKKGSGLVPGDDFALVTYTW